jgi:biopolymer transport protein ExbD
MALMKKRKRETPEIPSASMADIAFLLLIFFMVTTTIDVDTGIGLVLPPPVDPSVTPPPIKQRNVLKILVNSAGQVLVNDEESSISMIRELVKKHTTNNGADERFAESTEKALLSVKVDRETSYDIFMKVYDEINMGYLDLRRAYASQTYGTPYERLSDAQKKDADDKFKKKISFAEPEQSSK